MSTNDNLPGDLTIEMHDTDIIDGGRRGITSTIEIHVAPGNEELATAARDAVVDAIRDVSDSVDIRESYAVGSLYDGIFIVSKSFRIDATIVPYSKKLHGDIQKAVVNMIDATQRKTDTETKEDTNNGNA